MATQPNNDYLERSDLGQGISSQRLDSTSQDSWTKASQLSLDREDIQSNTHTHYNKRHSTEHQNTQLSASVTMSRAPEMQPNHPDPLVDRIPSRTSDKVETSEAPFQSIALPSGIPNPSAIGAASAPYAQTGPEAQDVQHVAEKSGSTVPAVGANMVKADMSIEKEALGIQPSSSSRSTSSEKIDEKDVAGKTGTTKKKGFFSRKKKDETIVDAGPKEKAEVPPVSLFTLYRYHTKIEVLVNILGLFMAIAAGATQPLMVCLYFDRSTVVPGR